MTINNVKKLMDRIKMTLSINYQFNLWLTLFSVIILLTLFNTFIVIIITEWTITGSVFFDSKWKRKEFEDPNDYIKILITSCQYNPLGVWQEMNSYLKSIGISKYHTQFHEQNCTSINLINWRKVTIYFTFVRLQFDGKNLQKLGSQQALKNGSRM